MKYRHLFIFLFLFLWIFLGFYLARIESPTFDEPVHLKAGYLYSTGDYNFDPIDPPLFRRVVYTLGKQIESITGPSNTLFPYRATVVILTGVSLCLLLWPLFSHSLFSGLLGSVLFVYEPSLIAHSHYFTTDAISAIISVVAALLILKGYWKTNRQFLILALFFALAISLKVATLALLLPVLLIKLPRLGKNRLIYLTLITLIIILTSYDFHFGGYLRAIKENILFGWRGQPIFFTGKLFIQAPFYKTLVVLLLKTTLPILILAVWSLKKGKNISAYLAIFIIIVLVNLFKPLNFGIRHLLPAEIALVLLASQVKPKSIVNWMIFSMLIIWQIISFRNALPQTLTYANELSQKPFQVFTDSDYDWGQGLLLLGQELSIKNITDYQLAYFGNVDPLLYLGRYTRIHDENPVGTLPIEKVNYFRPTIISVTCYYQCGYYQDPVFSRLPKQLIAQSFFYFP